MKTIPVKISWEILLILYGIFLLIVYLSITNPRPGAIIVAVIYFVLVTFCIFGIKYRMNRQTLEITNGIFGKTKIDIQKIHTVERTWNMLASPAPSISGRVEIYYGNKSIVIAPKDFNSFKDELLSINPDITVKA